MRMRKSCDKVVEYTANQANQIKQTKIIKGQFYKEVIGNGHFPMILL